ncbi:MAG: SRPBCC family protein [Burkholderiales bacterium]|nr:SRPBCC family protein [Anaerolineae bacterium]
MSVSNHSIVINRPIDVVFANTTCLRGCVKWMTSVIDAEKLGDEPVHVGTQYKHTFKFMGIVGETQVTVEIYNPPNEFAIKDPQAAFHYTFEEVAGGTRVNCQMTLTPQQDMGGLSIEQVGAGAAKQFNNDLNNLKEMLEADVVVQVA